MFFFQIFCVFTIKFRTNHRTACGLVIRGPIVCLRGHHLVVSWASLCFPGLFFFWAIYSLRFMKNYFGFYFLFLKDFHRGKKSRAQKFQTKKCRSYWLHPKGRDIVDFSGCRRAASNLLPKLKCHQFVSRKFADFLVMINSDKNNSNNNRQFVGCRIKTTIK